MSRKLRGSTNKGKTCHVVTKVNRDHRELDPKEDKERLIVVIAEAKKHLDFKCGVSGKIGILRKPVSQNNYILYK
ncbi:MAG: hypothetical protein LBB43_03030 [Spirochaetaceae bacterium]|jgi:hypothetical protein|nr:hypothetical protein [Spirochaetaceae bacterium]